MEVFQEQQVYSRRSKRQATKKLKNITNQTQSSAYVEKQKKPVKKNRVTRKRQKKTKEEPMSQQLLELKQQFQDLAKEKLSTIHVRKKQDNITSKAIALSVDKISKDSSHKLNRDLEINNNEVDTNISTALEDCSLLSYQNADQTSIDLLSFEAPTCEEIQLELSFERLSLSSLEIPDEESDDSDVLLDLTSIEEGSEENEEFYVDTFVPNEATENTSEIPCNTIIRLAQIIHDQKQLISTDEDKKQSAITESDRLASLIVQHYEFGNTEDIEIGDGEQTTTLNAVLQAMSTKQSTPRETELHEFQELSDSEEIDLNETDNFTIHGDFTKTLQSVMHSLR